MKKLPVISLLILTAVNIILLFLPLTSVFGYEFSVVNSVIILILCGVYTIRTITRSGASGKGKTLKEILKGASLFLAVPFLISVGNSLFTGFCSFIHGFSFYAVIVIPAALIGTALGTFAIFTQPRLKYLVFIALLLIMSAVVFYEIYFNPQNFFYSPLFGYFSGTIYDEGIEPDLKLFLYRAGSLVYFTFMFGVTFLSYFKRITVKKKLLVISFFGITSFLFVLISPHLGIAATKSSLTGQLSTVYQTPHFNIYYDSRIEPAERELIALHHEYYYSVLKEFFKVNLDGRVESFIFYDRAQKKELFGAENADVAKPWLNQIYTSKENINTTLRHEIAHCFTSVFGTGLFKSAEWLNPSLAEGAAMAADPFYGDNFLDYAAALAYKNGYKINIEQLFTGLNFFKQNSSISYIYAGSFVNFLITRYGISKFKNLYTNTDFQKVYSKPLSILIDEYFKYLSEWEADNKNKADFYFGRQSIFSKTCPRYISSLISKGWEHYNNKRYEKSEHVFTEAANLTPNYSAVSGLAATLNETGRGDSAVYIIRKYLPKFENTAYYFNLKFQMADFLSAQGEYSGADSLYSSLISDKPNRTLYNLSHLRIALRDMDTLLNIYINGKPIDRYLILRQLNKISYNYYSIPSVIDLSDYLEENYKVFLKQFDKSIIVSDEASSYAAYRLSEYALNNLDYIKARRLAALARRYKGDRNFNYITSEQFYKTEWFYRYNHIKSKFLILNN